MTGMSLNAMGDSDSRNIPHMEEEEGIVYPAAPVDFAKMGLSRGVFLDLCLKFVHTVSRCTSRWVAAQVMLPLPLVEELLMELAQDHMLEVLGLESASNHRYAATDRGHERAIMLLRISRYMGPAPVSLADYTSMIHIQKAWFAPATLEDVRGSLSELVLPDDDVTVAAMAVLAERSLLLWGPAGNGKSSVAKALHDALPGEFWIPYAIGVGTDIIQLFDPNIHRLSDQELPSPWAVDQRWVRIKRPLAIVGGEMTLDTLELAFDRENGFYEAPLHVKANHGVFVIDDFGRQRVDPWDLLNRWIVPMEHAYDYLRLSSGRKIQLPFELILIIATNLDPDKIMDPAFLRRIGYRIRIGEPTADRYCEIFQAVAARYHTPVPPGMLDRILDRYRAEHRELRACEPRDLISRVQDVCRLRGQELQMNDELLDMAWFGYFGTRRQEP